MHNMDNYNQPQKAPKDNRVLIYSLLGAALLLSWGYFIYTNRQAEETQEILTNKQAVITDELDDVRELYENSLFRLDSLMSENETLNESIAGSNTEIAKLKLEIGKILKNKNASDSELKKARGMISELNGKIENLAAEVARLQGENAELTATNTRITQEKQAVEEDLASTRATKEAVQKELDNTKDIASTLKASNINIVAINLKNSGKEKETTKARRADKLRINFDIDDNKIAQPGPKDLYVVVINPAGEVVSYTADDVFPKREGGTQPYTSKVTVNYEGGGSMPVSFDWKNDKDFTEGDYRIQIFHNGFKIGERVRSLKKGGIF